MQPCLDDVDGRSEPDRMFLQHSFARVPANAVLVQDSCEIAPLQVGRAQR